MSAFAASLVPIVPTTRLRQASFEASLFRPLSHLWDGGLAEKGNQIFLDGRFDFQSPALAFPKARLYADRPELSRWQRKGCFHRIVPLREAPEIDAPCELIWPSVRKTLRLNMEHAS